jgi:hypothetical protein
LQILQHGAPNDAKLLSRVELGYDLLYLLRGAPVVYYGDEVGMIGSGGDQAAREDMFPTQVAAWKTEPRVGSPPIGNGSSFDVTNPLEDELKSLAALRDANPALATGATINRLASKQTFVVSRIDRATRREYVVAFNSSTAAAKVTISTATPSSSWTRLLGQSGSVTSAASGSLVLALPPLSALVLKADSDLPKRAAPVPVLRYGTDDLSQMRVLTAKVATADPVSVTFAIRRGSGAWQRVASDDSPPYRAFLEPGKFRKGERVRLAAVVQATDGSTAISKPFFATPRH